MSEEKPYWWPVLSDESWCDRLRSEYPEHSDKSDEELRDHFADGWKYADVWDHLGDARDDWEGLADAFFEQQKELAALRKDKERKEWLVKNVVEGHWKAYQAHDGICFHLSGYYTADWGERFTPARMSMDEAIDAAMEAGDDA